MRKSRSVVGQLGICVAVIAAVVATRNQFTDPALPEPPAVATPTAARPSTGWRSRGRVVQPPDSTKTSRPETEPVAQAEGPPGKPQAGFRVRRLTSSVVAGNESDKEIGAVAGFIGPATDDTELDRWWPRGPELFSKKCESCHSLQEFRDDAKRSARDWEVGELYETIRGSHPGDPTFACTEAAVKLSDEDIHDLAGFLDFAQHRAVLGLRVRTTP